MEATWTLEEGETACLTKQLLRRTIQILILGDKKL